MSFHLLPTPRAHAIKTPEAEAIPSTYAFPESEPFWKQIQSMNWLMRGLVITGIVAIAVGVYSRWSSEGVASVLDQRNDGAMRGLKSRHSDTLTLPVGSKGHGWVESS